MYYGCNSLYFHNFLTQQTFCKYAMFKFVTNTHGSTLHKNKLKFVDKIYFSYSTLTDVICICFSY